MKLTFNTNDVLPQMVSVSKVLQAKATMPILENFVCKTTRRENGYMLVIMASDTQQWLKMYAPLIECDCDDEKTFLVDGKKILQTLSTLSGYVVTLDLDEENKIIKGKYQGGSFKLPYDNDVDSYPMPKLEEELTNIIEVSGEDLYKCINSTSYATSQAPIREIMQCVHFDISSNGFVVVASDGFKLVKSSISNVKLKEGEHHEFNIQQKSIDCVALALAKKQCNVIIRFNDKNVMFSCDDFTLVTRLKEGRYPNFDRVIPTDCDKDVVVNKQKLLDALSHIQVLGEKTQNLIHFEFENNTLKVVAENIDFSTSAEETISCEYQGEPFHIGLKGLSVATILSKIQGDETIMKMSVASRPVLFLQKNENNTVDTLSLLMPMLLN